MRYSRRFKWVIGLGGLLILVAAFALWPFRFYYDSVCSQCGAIRWTTEWQLPHSEHSFFKRSTVERTVLSSYLTSSGIVGPHSHQWLFGHGGDNGVRCALGPGDGIRTTVMSPAVVRLLAFSRQFGEQSESSNFLRFGLDQDISPAIRSLAASVPTDGFATRDQYRGWFSNQKWLIDDALEVARKER